MFFKIGFLKNFANSSEKRLRLRLFLIKMQIQTCDFVKKRLQNKSFLAKFAKFLRTHFLQNTSGGCFRKLKYRKKSITLNNEDLKRRTKRLNMKNTYIFLFTQPFQPVFTCPNSMIKTERYCAKYIQSKTKNTFCKTKCVKLIFYKFVHFLLL